MALRGRLPLDHDGLVGAPAGDDVLGGRGGWLLGQGHPTGHEARVSACPCPPGGNSAPRRSSPLRVLAELAPAHVVHSAQAELVGASGDQAPHHHRRQLGVDAGQQHGPGSVCGGRGGSLQGARIPCPVAEQSCGPQAPCGIPFPPSSPPCHLSLPRGDDEDGTSSRVTGWGRQSHQHGDNTGMRQAGAAPYCSRRPPRSSGAGGCCRRRAWPRSG